MRKTFTALGLTLVFLVLMDGLVAAVLAWAESSGKAESLVRYFDYGRSVPGKLAKWEANPGAAGNLYNVGWRPDAIKASTEAFAAESPDRGPVIRSYGMSFTNHILEAAKSIRPELQADLHAGPGAPPNYAYALFLDDRQNRRPGDIVVLGVLSTSTTAMAALSNRTWGFEQPAPFTYPVFYPDGGSLRAVEPVVKSAEMQRALSRTPELRAAWEQQLQSEDAFYSWISFGFRQLDHSPFARLLRRNLAMGRIHRTEARIISGKAYPYAETLQLMIVNFARTARAEGQTPIIMLVQSRNPAEANVLEAARPALESEHVLYLATAEYYDPRNPSGFLPDGHYKPEIDRLFGERFLELLDQP